MSLTQDSSVTPSGSITDTGNTIVHNNTITDLTGISIESPSLGNARSLSTDEQKALKALGVACNAIIEGYVAERAKNPQRLSG
jgi:hypothetical protein